MIFKKAFCKYKHCNVYKKLSKKFDLASEFEKKI
jgi:hypothetical protein